MRKWVVRRRMLGRAVVVMEAKTFCMSITRRAVVMMFAVCTERLWAMGMDGWSEALTLASMGGDVEYVL